MYTRFGKQQMTFVNPMTYISMMADSNSKVPHNLPRRVAIPNLKLLSSSVTKIALDPDNAI